MRHFRQQCGVVTQSPSMMSGSLRHNVTISAPGATDSEVWEALEAAALADEVRCMPLGLATPLGDGGLGLSGGQLQRLSLAGALARSPRLLISDESTAMIDREGRAQLMGVLASLPSRGIAVVHVTHDAGEVAGAERVIQLAKASGVYEGDL